MSIQKGMDCHDSKCCHMKTECIDTVEIFSWSPKIFIFKNIQLVARNCATALRVLDIEWSTKVFRNEKIRWLFVFEKSFVLTFYLTRWRTQAFHHFVHWSISSSCTYSPVVWLGRGRSFEIDIDKMMLSVRHTICCLTGEGQVLWKIISAR